MKLASFQKVMLNIHRIMLRNAEVGLSTKENLRDVDSYLKRNGIQVTDAFKKELTEIIKIYEDINERGTL